MIVTPRKLEQRARFYHQLATLVEAGLSLLQSLESLNRSRGRRIYGAPIQGLIDRLEAGETFSEAASGFRGWLPPFDLALLQAGERSGRLDVCFSTLSEFYEARAQAVREVIRNLIYPILIIHVAIFLGPFPKLFLTGEVQPYISQVVGLLVPLYLIVFSVYYLAQGQHGFRVRSLLEMGFQWLPLLGPAQKSLAISRFCLSLEALLAAGTNVTRAWECAADGSGSPRLQREVGPYLDQIDGGRTPGELLQESRWFPDVFVSLYSGGETSGRLDENLSRLRKHYHDEGFGKLRLFASWFPKIIYFGILIYFFFHIIGFYRGYFDQVNELSDF